MDEPPSFPPPPAPILGGFSRRRSGSASTEPHHDETRNTFSVREPSEAFLLQTTGRSEDFSDKNTPYRQPSPDSPRSGASRSPRGRRPDPLFQLMNKRRCSESIADDGLLSRSTTLPWTPNVPVRVASKRSMKMSVSEYGAHPRRTAQLRKAGNKGLALKGLGDSVKCDLEHILGAGSLLAMPSTTSQPPMSPAGGSVAGSADESQGTPETGALFQTTVATVKTATGKEAPLSVDQTVPQGVSVSSRPRSQSILDQLRQLEELKNLVAVREEEILDCVEFAEQLLADHNQEIEREGERYAQLEEELQAVKEELQASKEELSQAKVASRGSTRVSYTQRVVADRALEDLKETRDAVEAERKALEEERENMLWEITQMNQRSSSDKLRVDLLEISLSEIEARRTREAEFLVILAGECASGVAVLARAQVSAVVDEGQKKEAARDAQIAAVEEELRATRGEEQTHRRLLQQALKEASQLREQAAAAEDDFLKRCTAEKESEATLREVSVARRRLESELQSVREQCKAEVQEEKECGLAATREEVAAVRRTLEAERQSAARTHRREMEEERRSAAEAGEKLLTELAEAEHARADSKKQLVTAEARAAGLERKLRESDQTLSTVRAQANDAETQQADLRRRLVEVETQAEHHEAAKEKLTRDLTQLEGEASCLTAEKAVMRKEMQTREERIVELERGSVEIRALLAERDEALAAARRALTTAEGEVTVERQRSAALRASAEEEASRRVDNECRLRGELAAAEEREAGLRREVAAERRLKEQEALYALEHGRVRDEALAAEATALTGTVDALRSELRAADDAHRRAASTAAAELRAAEEAHRKEKAAAADEFQAAEEVRREASREAGAELRRVEEAARKSATAAAAELAEARAQAARAEQALTREREATTQLRDVEASLRAAAKVQSSGEAQLRDEIQRLQDQRRASADTLAELRSVSAASDERRRAMQHRIEELEADSGERAAEVARLRGQIGEREARVERLAADLQRAGDERNSAQEAAARSHAAVEDALRQKQRAEEMRHELTELKAIMPTLSSRAERSTLLEEKLRRAEREAREAAERLGDVEAQARASATSAKSAVETSQAMRDERDNALREVRELQWRLRQFDQTAQLQALERLNADYETKVALYKDSVGTLASVSSPQRSATASPRRGRLDRLRQRLNALNDEVSSAHQDHKRIEAQLREDQAKFSLSVVSSREMVESVSRQCRSLSPFGDESFVEHDRMSPRRPPPASPAPTTGRTWQDRAN
eukprot:Hpha_TRINITY_DN17056_c0_g1::TRINITY_DN17056_c0_g1_i1::g.165956::m.165956